MSKAVVADLYALQERDLELDRVTGEIEVLRRTLGEDATRPQREAALRARKRADQARTAAQTAEAALHEAEARIQRHERQLYGGGTGSRDLTALQTELTHLKTAHAEQEERVLTQMLAAEEADTAGRAALRALREAERAWEAKRQELGARLNEAETRLDEARARRADQAAAIAAADAAVLGRYDALRRTHGGLAVALVQANTCQACRVVVTSAALQRARVGAELVPCNNCGRILFVR